MTRKHPITHIVLIAGSFIMIFPFAWMVLTSLKTIPEQTAIPIVIFPSNFFNVENYKRALEAVPFLTLYINTLIMIAGRVACALLFSSMAAYGFARYTFPGKNILFWIVLIQMMVPGQIFIVPQYLMLSQMHLLNTLFALIFPAIVSAYGTFMLRQQYMSIPKDMEEAAMIDGCGPWRTFTKILLPMTRSSLSALGVFTALFAWKDLMWPLIANNDINKMSLAPGLSVLQGMVYTNKGAVMAGAVVATIPMLALYIIFQKQFIEGMVTSGIKG